MNKFISFVLLIFFVPLLHFSHLMLNDSYKGHDFFVEEKFNLPSPELTKIVSLGYDNLLADLLWLQMIQYYGQTLMEKRMSPEMYSLIQNIVELDPKFTDAYVFGSFALIDNEQFDQSIEILNKGSKRNPDDWYFDYQAGLLYYIYKKNKQVAFNYFVRSAKAKNAPPLPSRLAAKISDQTGSDLELRKELWESVYERSKAEGDKVNLEKAYKELVEIKIETDLDLLRNAISKYSEMLAGQSKEVLSGQTKKEKSPVSNLSSLESLKQLKEAGLLEQLPVDPFNRSYLFNSLTLEVSAQPLPWGSEKKR